MMSPRKIFTAAAVCALVSSGSAWAQDSTFTPTVGQSGKDVIWVPTSQAMVDRMLDMAGLTPQDQLVDLGSGDGRTVITAARRGATARGVEFNPDMVALSRRAAEKEGVADRAKFDQADIFKSDFSNATIVTLFLLPDLNLRLRPTLLDMKPGTRVVSNSFNMGDWAPDETARVTEGCSDYCTAYKWVVPAKVAGTWKLADQELALTQNYQMLEGTLGKEPIGDARLDGAQIRFSVGKDVYAGAVDGNRMLGTVNGKTSWSATLM